MKDLARRVWVVTLAALVIFAIYESVKTALLPELSAVSSHVITVIVVAVMTFFVSRYAFTRYSQALSETQRQTKITEEINTLLTGVLATMHEAVVIVDSHMLVALYNDAAAAMFGASISKWARSASRVSLRPNPSVPSVMYGCGAHGATRSGRVLIQSVATMTGPPSGPSTWATYGTRGASSGWSRFQRSTWSASWRSCWNDVAE